ncbi:MAG: hypothetical protein HY784_07355 [Chloroflexi bacterium]|nr:hypothetical protein [Chloroflexota bacterium]
MRSPVDRSGIERFLRQLGQSCRQPGRLYLVGGTTLVFEGYRQQTLDIDLVIDVSAEHQPALIRAIRALKESLDVNVEEASPGDFIPLPAGFSERHEYIGRFGQLDVFHFDLYSAALSKIERGRGQDFADVLLLLSHRRVDWGRLERYFSEILPQIGTRSLRQDPEEFEMNFRALARMWHEENKPFSEQA